MPTTTSKLLDYIQSMSSNATALREFHNDPAGAAKKAGLTGADAKALLSRNPGAIAAAISAERHGGVATVGHGRGGVAADGDDINVTVVVVVAP